MPVPVLRGIWKEVNSLLQTWDEKGQFTNQSDPYWLVARAIAELLPGWANTRLKKDVDREHFPSHTMRLGPNALLGSVGAQTQHVADPLDLLREQTALTILSFEHFWPDHGRPACVSCGSNARIVRDGWARYLKRYYTTSTLKGLILSATYKCANCPSKHGRATA